MLKQTSAPGMLRTIKGDQTMFKGSRESCECFDNFHVYQIKVDSKQTKLGICYQLDAWLKLN